MIISLDTETTGVDLSHGAMPFLITTCDQDGVVRFWEWDVDPVTRLPDIPAGDCTLIRLLITAADLIYLQVSKFDARALRKIGIDLPWAKVRDTLAMGHLLASNHPHGLDKMCEEYLQVSITKYEDAVEAMTKSARAVAKREFPYWTLADEGLPGMPSVKGSTGRDEDKPWKNDMWLPRALAKAGSRQFIPEQWRTACAEYANADSTHTLFLGLEMERIIKERGLWAIYEHRLNLPRVACEMEFNGVTAIGEYTEATIYQYEEYSAEAGCELRSIAAGYGHELVLADGPSLNDNMREFFYGSLRQHCPSPSCKYEKCVKHWNGERLSTEPCPKCAGRKRNPQRNLLVTTQASNLALPVIAGKKTGNASLDKDAMGEYLATLEGEALAFCQILTDKRKHDTDLGYMRSYRRFWLPVHGTDGYFQIHPSLNPFGTDHLRWASNSPNLQNVGKQEDECEECEGRGCQHCNHTGKSRVSVRNCFGPAPGREWYSLDYRSIERRIPPYECGEPKMVEVFEHPDKAPYWGSLYYLTASVLYPKEFWPLAEFPIDHAQGFKKKHPRLYKQAKFFDLAKQYGCGRRKGDLLSKVTDSFDRVDNEFPMLAALQAKYLRMAENLGYVETLPNRTIDPTRGYPILASRTDDGRILSTTPFNYHVSGTACDVKNSALVDCSAECATWCAEGFDARMCLDIHDEILFDFPRGPTPDANLWRARVLQRLMEAVGENVVPRIPTPVSVEYHAVSWAEGQAV